jgi:hypothetical protein
MDDEYDPHDKSSMEKAEGSRENLNVDSSDADSADVNHGSATDNPMERGAGQVSRPEKPLPSTGARRGRRFEGQPGSGQGSAGITSRPLDEEEQDQ